MVHPGEEREAVIDRLYELPLDEFTPARDELTRRLRSEGDREAGAEVKRLRKPSVAAWALNRVRRTHRAEVDRLIEAGAKLRGAQERLLAGGGREALQQAAAEERRLVGELSGHAERELAAVGRSAGGNVREKLRATLHAVASDPEARDLLAAGRLVRDHEASGLGPLSGRPAPAARAGPGGKEPSAKAAAQRRKVARLQERLERARARAAEIDEEGTRAERRLREARHEAKRAAAELERAETADERARSRAEQAAAKVAALERELRGLAG